MINNEQKIIQTLFSPLSKNAESMNLENDAAFLKNSNKNLVVTSDMMIENVHFETNDNPVFLAQKVLRVNLSDLAAMGSKPYGYILNLGLPKNKTSYWLKNFCKGLKLDQTKYDLKLFGGDLSRSENIFISITMIGKSNSKIHYCDKAKKNTDIFVSGYLGDSSINFFLKKTKNKAFSNIVYKDNFLPIPRITLGSQLIGHCDVCTDISDGLLIDLKKISNFSKLGAKVYLNKIPLSSKAKKIKKVMNDNKNFWELILTGGEDYELLFSMNKQKQKVFFNKFKNKLPKITKIGHFYNGEDIDIFIDGDKKIKLRKMGFSHF